MMVDDDSNYAGMTMAFFANPYGAIVAWLPRRLKVSKLELCSMVFQIVMLHPRSVSSWRSSSPLPAPHTGLLPLLYQSPCLRYPLTGSRVLIRRSRFQSVLQPRPRTGTSKQLSVRLDADVDWWLVRGSLSGTVL